MAEYVNLARERAGLPQLSLHTIWSWAENGTDIDAASLEPEASP